MDGPKTLTPILLLRGRLNRSLFMEWQVIRIPRANTSQTITFTALIGEHSLRAEPFATFSRSRRVIHESTRRMRRTVLRLKVDDSYYLLSLVAFNFFFTALLHKAFILIPQGKFRATLISCFLLLRATKCCETTAYDEHLTTTAQHFLTANA